MAEKEAPFKIKAVIQIPGKQTLKLQFLSDTKMLNIEEFLKRKINIKPTESIYLFDERRTLISKTAVIGDLLRPKNQENPQIKIIVRKTETF